ncbi:hypothetical protein F5Y10DRAFT_290235 [Nemania abortiva]|nr:hypothetical protein F5Y10DRAFT_290235 [Nemania abortiva]
MYKLVFEAWKRLSVVGYQAAVQYDNSGVQVDGFADIPAGDGEEILYIKSHCRPNSSQLRSKADGYFDGASYAVKRKTTTDHLNRWAKALPSAEFKFKNVFSTNQVVSKSGKRKSNTSSAKIESMQNDAKARAAKKRASDVGNVPIPVPSPGTQHLTYGKYQDVTFEPQASASRASKTAPTESALRANTTSETGISLPANMTSYIGVDSTADNWLDVQLTYQVSSDGPDGEFDEMASFLLQLEQPMLEVDGTPDVDDNFPLSITDPLRIWLLQALQANPSPDQASVSVKLLQGSTSMDAKVISFKIDVPAKDTKPALIFSTTALQGNFSDRGLPSLENRPPTIPESGFEGVHSFLCLGLVNNSTTWSIQDVFLQSNIDISDSVEGYGAVLAVVFQKFQALQDLKLELERGMIWFLPSESYRTVQRLEWTLGAGAAGSLEEWCTELMPNVSIQNPTIVSRRECTKADVGDTTELSFEHELLFMFGITSENPSYVVTCGLDLNLKDGSEMLTAIIRVDPMTQDTRVNLEDFVGWLVPSVDISGIADIIPFIENVGVRSVELDINIAGKISISQITVMAEYSWQLTGSDGNEKPVPLLLTYVWTKDRAQPHSVNLKSWLQPDILQWFTPQIMPKYEDLYYIRPSSVPTNELNLKDLMPGDYHLPAELSLDISNLALEFKDTTVTIAGRLQKANDTETFGILLEEVDITASFMWGDKGNTKKNRDPNSFEISLQTTILLKPSSERVSIIATIDGKIPEEMAIVMCEVTLQKSGNQWNFQLIGDVTDLTLAHLGVFFPPDDADIMIDLLGHIGIQSLDIEYNYNSGMQTGSTGPSAPNAPKGASVSDFSMSAVLLLDVLELDFTFVRDEDSWSLDAVLRSVDVEEITVGTVLRSLLGEKGQESTVDIPSFVSNINISNAAVKLSVRSINATEGTAMGAVSVCLAIDVPCSDNSILEFAFLQTTNKTGTLRPLAAPAPPNIQNATKRMIKVNLGSLPWNKIPKVPVIDRMKPAFDSLAFYWVLDPTWKDATKLPGLTRQEVERLNELSPILFKDKQKATPDTKPDPNAASAIVLAAGMHFLVPDSVSQGTPRAILDYLFNKPRAPSPMLSQALAVDQSGILIQAVDDTPTGTSNATLEKNMGAFSISNVGLRYQDSELIIYLDIAANLGPIKLALHKFGFGFNLGAISLKDITENQVPSFHLEGMGVEFNKPPISIAGTFLHHETESVETYVGGINLTIQPYSFMAVGGYSEIHNKNTSGNFKSVFFFAKLNGPLIELEFVTIGGICLGFGYNSVIRFPSIQELPQFPFLANSSLPNNDPLAIMTKLSSTDPVVGVVSPKDSSYWLAAGLEAKALEVLDVSAVVILEFNPYVSLGVFAKAIGQMPPTPAPREACFLYVELGVLTTIDLSAGTLRVEAQLSPNSFIIAPSCRLTGGFALCYWFPPSGHAGDFVFSVGGYHNAFKPPAHYPVPPRLGITWNFGIVSVTGEAYWAITPKACMGGGKLKLNYNLGLLHAWLAVTADFLMEYHPFKFIADIGVEVGVHFILEILFISIDISISIRAELTLWGVPFGGEVYVDFWVFGFTIGFGESQRDPAVNLEAFRELLIQVPDSDSATSEGQNAGSVDKLHVLSVESGRYSENAKPDDTTTKQGDVWEVKRGGFVFRVQSRVPLQSIVELEFTNDPVKGPATSTRSDKSFYARPMQLQSQLTSTMTVGITKKEDGEILEFPLVRQVVKQVPLALWGYYDPAKAPGRNKNNIADLLDPKDGTIELMTGASFQCPLPEIAEDHLVPFNALESASQDVFTDADPQQPGGDEHPQLRGDVVFQDGTWRPAQPVVDEEDKAKQWEVVKAAWEAPEIVANEDPSGLPVDILGVAAALWSDAFGWGFGDNETNGLKNEVSLMADGNPIVWKSFEEIYMAAPLVGVTA